ncbi:MAG: hypothetical protein Q8P60_12410 [Pseudorhodobacter sp.]|nr:hypothetical protein [Pseudorhodobacter sp.]
MPALTRWRIVMPGRVAGLVFKTLRYPGHLDYMQFLLPDMGLGPRL